MQTNKLIFFMSDEWKIFFGFAATWRREMFAVFVYELWQKRKNIEYSTNHVYLHRPNAFGFWQLRLHLCYESLKRISNFSELA